MNKPVEYVMRYRVYCYIGRHIYYCNRSIHKQNYRWTTRDEEYPDHFDIVETSWLMNRFSHLMPKMEEIPVIPGEDS